MSRQRPSFQLRTPRQGLRFLSKVPMMKIRTKNLRISIKLATPSVTRGASSSSPACDVFDSELEKTNRHHYELSGLELQFKLNEMPKGIGPFRCTGSATNLRIRCANLNCLKRDNRTGPPPVSKFCLERRNFATIRSWFAVLFCGWPSACFGDTGSKVNVGG
jgi:hypothetical protein